MKIFGSSLRTLFMYMNSCDAAMKPEITFDTLVNIIWKALNGSNKSATIDVKRWKRGNRTSEIPKIVMKRGTYQQTPSTHSPRSENFKLRRLWKMLSLTNITSSNFRLAFSWHVCSSVSLLWSFLPSFGGNNSWLLQIMYEHLQNSFPFTFIPLMNITCNGISQKKKNAKTSTSVEQLLFSRFSFQQFV